MRIQVSVFRTITAMVLLLLFAFFAAPAPGQAPAGDELINAKCSFCHSSKRIYNLDAEELKAVVQRMRKMNPDWITEVDSRHIVEKLSVILKDPNIIATRKAWQEAVERGAALFKKSSLGASGKSCSSCHDAASMRNVGNDYPVFDSKLGRFVTFSDKVRMMVTEQVKGEAFSANDQRLLDLMVYLQSLN